jgi:hypothetical protein
MKYFLQIIAFIFLFVLSGNSVLSQTTENQKAKSDSVSINIKTSDNPAEMQQQNHYSEQKLNIQNDTIKNRNTTNKNYQKIPLEKEFFDIQRKKQLQKKNDSLKTQ